MSDNACNPFGAFAFLPGLGNLTECVPLNSCHKILDNSNAPNNQTQPCGFDEETQTMMICCPPELVEDPIVSCGTPALFKLTSSGLRDRAPVSWS